MFTNTRCKLKHITRPDWSHSENSLECRSYSKTLTRILWTVCPPENGLDFYQDRPVSAESKELKRLLPAHPNSQEFQISLGAQEKQNVSSQDKHTPFYVDWVFLVERLELACSFYFAFAIFGHAHMRSDIYMQEGLKHDSRSFAINRSSLTSNWLACLCVCGRVICVYRVSYNLRIIR